MPNTDPLKRVMTAVLSPWGRLGGRSRRYPVRSRTGARLASAPAFFAKSRLMALVVHLLEALCSLAE